MAAMESTIRATDEQVESFCKEGYLAIDCITTDEEVEHMRVAYDELFERRAGREDGLEYDLVGTDEEGVEAKLPQILEPRNHSDALRVPCLKRT